MSIFPDDKRRKRDEDDLTEDARRRGRDEPAPNPTDAFQGGAIRGADGSKIEIVGNQIRIDGKTVGRGGRKGRSSCGCLLGLLIAAAVAVPIFVFVIGPMTGLFNVFGEDTREIPGDAAAFDPIASFAEIEAYARGEAPSIEFIEMDAIYVKSDGTLDLTATSYHPRVTYRFVVPAERPEDAPPIGAGGTTGDYARLVTINAFEPGQLRSVRSMSGGVSTEYTYLHLGLERDVDDPTPANHQTFPPPACSLADLWAEAIRHDAPRDAVAMIDYEDGEYTFSISDVRVRLTFDQSCRLVD